MTLASHKPYWIVASGEVASVGTRVVTDLAPDSVGVIVGCGDESASVAKVRLTAGLAAGDIRICTPGEMLRKA